MIDAQHLSHEDIAAIAELMLQIAPAGPRNGPQRLAIRHLTTCESCRRRLDTFVGDDIALEIAVVLTEAGHVASAEEDRAGELTARMMTRLRSGVSSRAPATTTLPEGIVGAQDERVEAQPRPSDASISPLYGNPTSGPMLPAGTSSASRLRDSEMSARIPRSPRSRFLYRASIGVVPLLLAASVAIVLVRDRRTLREFASPSTVDSTSKADTTPRATSTRADSGRTSSPMGQSTSTREQANKRSIVEGGASRSGAASTSRRANVTTPTPTGEPERTRGVHRTPQPEDSLPTLDAEIKAVVARYESALNARDTSLIRELYPTVPDSALRASITEPRDSVSLFLQPNSVKPTAFSAAAQTLEVVPKEVEATVRVITHWPRQTQGEVLSRDLYSFRRDAGKWMIIEARPASMR